MSLPLQKVFLTEPSPSVRVSWLTYTSKEAHMQLVLKSIQEQVLLRTLTFLP
jgi:hypothetical protein